MQEKYRQDVCVVMKRTVKNGVHSNMSWRVLVYTPDDIQFIFSMFKDRVNWPGQLQIDIISRDPMGGSCEISAKSFARTHPIHPEHIRSLNKHKMSQNQFGIEYRINLYAQSKHGLIRVTLSIFAPEHVVPAGRNVVRRGGL
jgi:hypothetical protein